MSTLDEAFEIVERFKADSLRKRIADLQRELRQCESERLASVLSTYEVHSTLLDSALALKRASSQINEVVHATGILLSLPHILVRGESIESLSLAAGNTGKQFDLETNIRVAEFKFIDWKGGPESIRQNQLFKDFYWMAEAGTRKEKYLYVLGKEYPLRFLNGGRKLSSVTSRNTKLQSDLYARYGNRFSIVRDYYDFRKDLVKLVDLLELVPYFSE